MDVMLPCEDLGDELENQMLRLEADSIDDELFGGAAASKWIADPDFALLGSQDPFASCVSNSASLQSTLGLDGLDPTLWAAQPPMPASMVLSDSELDELTRASRKALITAAKRNRLSVSNYGMPAQPGAWQGCEQSPWCNAPEHHVGPCNAKATVPGIAAYECMNEVDDTGAILDNDDATLLGQADSSAAGSGKHGSSATYHEEGENSSPAGRAGVPSKPQWMACGATTETIMMRSVSAGNVPGTARAHASANSFMAKLELDTGLPASWMTARTSSHPLSNHCPGATNIELLETPEEAAPGNTPAVTADAGRSQPGQQNVLGAGELRMADMSSINASWPVLQNSGSLERTAASASQLPSSFMIVNDPAGWTDTSSGPSEHQHDKCSAGAWSDNSHNSGDDGDGIAGERRGASADGAARRPLRTTRSVPNFRSMALNGGNNQHDMPPPAELPPSAASVQPAQGASGGAGGVRRVIIHRWPSSTSGPSLARKSRAAEELARSGSAYKQPTSADGSGSDGLRVAVPTPSHSSAGSLVDLASPLSSGPSSVLTSAPQRLLPGSDAEDMKRAVGSNNNNTERGGEPSQPRHSHNLRGRTHVSHAALHEGLVGRDGSAWQQPQHGGPAAGVVGVRTSRLPEVPPPQTHVGKKRGASGGPGSTCARPVPHPNGHCCTACSTTVTPVWRAGPQGPKTLCNACGVRYMKVAKRK